MKKHSVNFQLVPPHNHRANLAERAIQTFKTHFEAGLANLHPDFPISEWNRLSPQAFITLNLQRSSHVNPNLSTYSYLFGNFDFNKTPMAPPGSKILFHIKPAQHAFGDLNGILGFYIAPALNHYRCLTYYNPTTKSEIISDTVVFTPHVIPIPAVTIDNFLYQAASDIINVLTQSPPLLPSTYKIGNKTCNGLLQLATLLKTN